MRTIEQIKGCQYSEPLEWYCECGNQWALDGTRVLTRNDRHICPVPVFIWEERLRRESRA